MNHLPILPVLLPSLAAILMLLPPLSTRLTMQRWMTWGVLIVLVVIGGILVHASTASDAYLRLGGWQPPFGILFVVDRLAALLIALTAVLAFCAGLYSAEKEDRKGSFLLSAIPVSGHGHQWRFSDRRPFQSLRILRNPADRVVCTASFTGAGARRQRRVFNTSP
jgi:formate hydrogenlyase subunit 3/multisubunit Na+/H+ antiporter MnhD subunit